MGQLHALENDSRIAPEKCIRKLLADIESGALKVRRIALVVEDEVNGEVSIRAGGAGMDYVPTTVGLLYVGADSLCAITRE